MATNKYTYHAWWRKVYDYLQAHYNYEYTGPDEADGFIDDCYDEGVDPESCAIGIANAYHLAPVESSDIVNHPEVQ